MKRSLPFVIVAVVALLTVGSGAMLYRQKSRATAAANKAEGAPRKGGSEPTHIRGEDDAPVTLEEFGDFQCPPCAMISNHLDETEREYRPRLRLVFRNFPLPVHAHAAEAAYAAEAAGLQGRFWEMHDLLYREQANWSKALDVPALFNSYAQTLGLDLDRFKTDIQSPAVKAAVEADKREGAERGVKSTPTIFVNGVVLAPSSLNQTGVRGAIDLALKEPSSPKPK